MKRMLVLNKENDHFMDRVEQGSSPTTNGTALHHVVLVFPPTEQDDDGDVSMKEVEEEDANEMPEEQDDDGDVSMQEVEEEDANETQIENEEPRSGQSNVVFLLASDYLEDNKPTDADQKQGKQQQYTARDVFAIATANNGRSLLRYESKAGHKKAKQGSALDVLEDLLSGHGFDLKHNDIQQHRSGKSSYSVVLGGYASGFGAAAISSNRADATKRTLNGLRLKALNDLPQHATIDQIHTALDSAFIKFKNNHVVSSTGTGWNSKVKTMPLEQLLNEKNISQIMKKR
jgi:hypothetical protein